VWLKKQTGAEKKPNERRKKNLGKNGTKTAEEKRKD